MPNTLKKTGNLNIKILHRTVLSKSASTILDLLHVHDKKSHALAVDIAGQLMDALGDDPKHPMNTFFELLMDAIERYENAAFPVAKASPQDIVKFLMEQHKLLQTDLANEFGGQSVVSLFLKGKRNLNVSQIKALAERFNVEASVFLQ